MNSYVFILKLRTNLVLLFVSGFLFYGDEYLSVCICIICIQCSERPEKGVGAPGTEVQMFVSCHVDAGNRTQVLSKGSQGSCTVMCLVCQDPWSFDLLI